MKRTVWMTAIVALALVTAALTYQVAARAAAYRLLLARGDQALHDDQTFVAIEAYSGAIALRPDSMLAHLRRGETYQRRGNLDAASRDFRDAADIDPTAPRPIEALGDVLYQRQWFTRAADAFEAGLRLDDRSPRMLYKLALARYRSGEAAGAAKALTQALRLDPRFADAEYLLGICLRDTGRFDEAQQALERAIELAPRALPPREELADLAERRGRHADAIAQLQALASLDRDHIERQIALALAHARAGQDELAVLTLGRALDRSPDQPRVYAALGQVWLRIADTRHDPVALGKAIEALARASGAPGAASDVLTMYGRALLLDGQANAAAAVLRDATARYPVDTSSYLEYATAAERTGELDAARQALIEYGALATGDRELAARALRIAALSIRMHEPDTAREWLRRAAPLEAPIAPFADEAQAELGAGDRDAAAATIARALSTLRLAGP